jgi:hypothetical protein
VEGAFGHGGAHRNGIADLTGIERLERALDRVDGVAKAHPLEDLGGADDGGHGQG